MPLISIVLPTYNGEKYVQKALDSILLQTFQDWELIVVNDCSTDQTKTILQEYERRDKRIRILNNEMNLKLPRSLNKGFQIAQGKYLTWTSDDNMYHVNALQEMIVALEEHPEACLVYAQMVYIDEQGDVVSQTHPKDVTDLYFANVVGACFLYRRDILETVGQYDTDLFGVEDYDYWLRILEKYPVISLHDVLYDYRIHRGSLTSKMPQVIRKRLTRLMEKHMDIFLEKFAADKSMLHRLYVNLIFYGLDRKLIGEKFQKFFDTEDFARHDFVSNSTVIFGAGKTGNRAFDWLQGKGVAFIDNDCSKIGTYLRGRPVLSLSDALVQYRDFQILVAVSDIFVYEVVKQLEGCGAKRYCIYQQMEDVVLD